ncbi:MAG: 4a-hydroxytetrahydrobiopterin dehydratase [Pseudomonadota bacterium]
MSPDDVDSALTDLDGWSAVGDRPAIEKTFKFADFNAAWAFMSACALWAEKNNHHPEWNNVYSRVGVVLTTHDAGGVTELDVGFARFMNEVAG